MPTPISLKEIVGQIDICPPEGHVMIHRKTGACHGVSDDEMQAADDEADAENIDDLPAWQKEAWMKAREILDSDDWLEFPKQDFDEYSVIRDFVDTVDDPHAREGLQAAIQGKGAFRRFKDAALRYGIQNEWYRYRNEELESFVAQWLDAHQIPYSK